MACLPCGARRKEWRNMLTLTNIQKTFGIGTVNEKAALRGIDLHLLEYLERRSIR